MGISARKRVSRALLFLLAMFVLGMGLLIYLAPRIDISAYQQDLAALISNTIQRKFELHGKLFIKLGLKPTIVTGRLAVQNPGWCKTRYLLKAEQVEVGVDLLDLLRDKITIDRLVLKQASLNLEYGDKRNNWTFGKAQKPTGDNNPAGGPIRLDFAILDDVSINYYAAKQHKRLVVKHARLRKNIRRRYKLDLDGRLDKQRLLIQASSNRWFDVQDFRPLELKLDTQLGTSSLSASIALQQIVPRVQANIKLESGKLDIDSLQKEFLSGNQADKNTAGLNSFDPWLRKIGYVSLEMKVDKLLYSDYEIRNLSLQNRIVQDASRNNEMFSVYSSGKAGQIIYKKMLESEVSPNDRVTHRGQAGFSLNSHGNTLQQLFVGADIRLDAQNLVGNYPRHFHVKHLKLVTDGKRSMRIEGEASYNKQAVTFSMKTGEAFLDLLYRQGMGHLDMQLGSGKAKLTVNSTSRDIFKSGRQKIHLRLAGDYLAQWGALFGLELPELRRYRLDSRFEIKRQGIKVSRFTIKTPDSKLKGKLFYRYGKRGRLDARLDHSRFSLADLNKRVKTMPPKQPAPQTKPKANVMVIPKTDLMALLSPAIDVNLAVNSSDLLFSKFAVKDLDLKMRRQDKVFAIQINKGRLADGALTADVYMTVVDKEAAGKIEIDIKQLDYGKLLQDMGVGDKMEGKADVNIHLVGFGKNFKAFLTHSDGTADFVGEKGILVSKYLRLWGEDIVQQILPFNWFESDRTKINCVVGRFDLTDGRLSSDSLLLDTENMTIAGTGAINLATEQLAFELMPDPKNISLISLATPVKIRGTLANPRIEPHTLGTTWTIGSLLAGLANPAILIARFAKLGSLGVNPCLAAIGKKESEESSILKAFKDAVKFIQRPLDKLPDVD